MGLFLQDQQLIQSYRSETQAKLRQVEDLSDPDHPRVFHVTQCAACKGQLDLPSVHFMCNHSYHQRYDFQDSPQSVPHFDSHHSSDAWETMRQNAPIVQGLMG